MFMRAIIMFGLLLAGCVPTADKGSSSEPDSGMVVDTSVDSTPAPVDVAEDEDDVPRDTCVHMLEEIQKTSCDPFIVFEDTMFAQTVLLLEKPHDSDGDGQPDGTQPIDENGNGLIEPNEASGVIDMDLGYAYPSPGLVQDVTGVECFENLEVFRGNRHSIKDVSPFSGLSKLRELTLNMNAVESLAPLANLQQLRELWVDGTFSDVCVVEWLPELEVVEFESPNVTDLSPLATVPSPEKMRSLSLLFHEGPGGQDFSPIATFPALEKLQIRSPSLTENDLKFIANPSGLTTLLLSGQIVSIEELVPFGNLTWLSLSQNRIVDIAPLVNLDQLSFLALRENKIEVVEPLLNIHTLTAVLLGENPIDCDTQYQYLIQLPLPSGDGADDICPP